MSKERFRLRWAVLKSPVTLLSSANKPTAVLYVPPPFRRAFCPLCSVAAGIASVRRRTLPPAPQEAKAKEGRNVMRIDCVLIFHRRVKFRKKLSGSRDLNPSVAITSRSMSKRTKSSDFDSDIFTDLRFKRCSRYVSFGRHPPSSELLRAPLRGRSQTRRAVILA